MGAHFSIDVTEVKMFAGAEWWDLGDPCDHGCQHRSRKVQAWGPTVATYELVECTDCGCRAWEDGRYEQERQRASGLHGFWYERIDWRKPVDNGRTETPPEPDQNGSEVAS